MTKQALLTVRSAQLTREGEPEPARSPRTRPRRPWGSFFVAVAVLVGTACTQPAQPGAAETRAGSTAATEPAASAPPLLPTTQPSPAAGPEGGARATDTAAPRQLARGNLLRIQGRFVQLPVDAYIQREITETSCTGSEQCAQIPIYEIVRGNSTVAVSGRSGAILSDEVAPGEEGAFEFLRPAR